MFYDIISRVFGYQHLYQFVHTSGQHRVYHIEFALDYDKTLKNGGKLVKTRSWRKAMKWIDKAYDVTPMGYIPHTGRMEASCGLAKDYDLYTRRIELNCGTLTYIGRCRKSRRWL